MSDRVRANKVMVLDHLTTFLTSQVQENSSDRLYHCYLAPSAYIFEKYVNNRWIPKLDSTATCATMVMTITKLSLTDFSWGLLMPPQSNLKREVNGGKSGI